LVTWSLFKKS